MEKESMSSSEEEIQTNGSMPDEVAAEQSIPEPPPSPPLEPSAAEGQPEQAGKKPWLKQWLGWIAALLAALIIGAALAIFLLYLPADRALRQAQSDLSSTQNELEVAQSKADGLQTSLSDANNQVDAAKTSLESANLRLVVARLQANIAYARVALLSKDTLTARQELSDADANLSELTLLLDDSETTSALADRLKTIRASLTSDSSKALDEMRKLGENLSRLENR